jgi:hypothetical protein
MRMVEGPAFAFGSRRGVQNKLKIRQPRFQSLEHARMELLLKTDLGPAVDCDTPPGKLLSATEERRLKHGCLAVISDGGGCSAEQIEPGPLPKIEIPH